MVRQKILRFLWSTFGLICLVCKETQNPFSDSFRFTNQILDFLKETHPKTSTYHSDWRQAWSELHESISLRDQLPYLPWWTNLRMYIACRPHQTRFLSLIPDRSILTYIHDHSAKLEKRFHDKLIGGYRSGNAAPQVFWYKLFSGNIS